MNDEQLGKWREFAAHKPSQVCMPGEQFDSLLARLEAAEADLAQADRDARSASAFLQGELAQAREANASLRAVVDASRAIRAKYPGGKMLWFSEFDAFEKALAALDAKPGEVE